MTDILCIAPHPDDETLGCGGTLLRHRAEGNNIHWLVVTTVKEELGYSAEVVSSRMEEVRKVNALYDFSSVHDLGFSPSRLDTMPKQEVLESVRHVLDDVKPEILYLPYRGDIHSDHAIVFDAAISYSKWFRSPSIKRILAYETLSETNFNISPAHPEFRPNVFVNIESQLVKKIEIMRIYRSELAEPPFPRNETSLRALAELRGSQAGFKAADAFILLKEVQ